MRAHDHDNKLDQDRQNVHQVIAAPTNIPDAAQAQEAVVPSRKLVSSGTESGSTEASGGLEDARRLLDISSSSISEDMGGGESWR